MIFNRHFSFIVLLCSLVACKNKPNTLAHYYSSTSTMISQDSLTLLPEKGLVLYLGKPFTGTSVSYLDTVAIVQIDYLNGKKHGLYQKRFDQGTLSFESHYIDGKRHGLTKTWWKNGQLRSSSNYEHGIPHGLQKQWYKSGSKFKFRNLNHGKEEGLQQSWRENGKLYNNYEAKNGRIFGLKRATLCYELDDEEIQFED